MKSEFSDLGLHPQLVQAVVERGYVEPTPIQSGVIPLLLAGRDVLGQAQTGTGKTAAFALPMLQALVPGEPKVQGLVLAPTRELALQVAGAIEAYGRHQDVRVLAVYGGQPYPEQLRALRKGVDVVVGTPGRVLDLVQRGSLDLGQVGTVVLDEADEMFSMGFVDDMEAILATTPETRQTALFSATLPPEIRGLADRYLRDPHQVTIQGAQRTVAGLEQRYYLVHPGDKLAALTRLLEMETITSAIVFVRTRADTGELANALASRGYAAEAINGDLSQDMRERVLERFRRGQVPVLVATDVAARGLDIDNVSHVFNYDLPMDEEVYVHRVGRTGRAGRTGVAISLVGPKEQWYLRRIEWYTKERIVQTPLPTVEDIQRHRDAQLMAKMQVWLRRGRGVREREMVAEMTEAGHELADIAVAALKLVRAAEQHRSIEVVTVVEEGRAPEHQQSRRQPGTDSGRAALPQQRGRAAHRDRDSVSRPRSGQRPGRGMGAGGAHEKGMVRLALSAGRDQGVRPSDVVGAIAAHAAIPGHVLGKISIEQARTLVDVPEQHVSRVLAKSGSYRIRRHIVTVEHAS
jgi:ATP-dependent RNA helicase DeaD